MRHWGIQNLGFIKPTESRRIRFEDALRFERVHEETYRKYSFACVFIAPGGLSDRANAIMRAVSGAAPSLPSPASGGG